MTQRWNHNLHYAPIIVDVVPPGAARALDVGCGEGSLSRHLLPRVGQVVGIDTDEVSLRSARAESGGSGIGYVRGDFLSAPFPPLSFDFVGCVAALHHMDERAALVRMRDLLRPGGALGVVGLARRSLPRDLPMELAGAVATRLHQRRKSVWETPAPKVWPPPSTFAELRGLTGDVLPGARFRHHAMGRYTLTWTKPSAPIGRGERSVGAEL